MCVPQNCPLSIYNVYIRNGVAEAKLNHFFAKSPFSDGGRCGKEVWGHCCPLWLPIWSGNGPKYGYFWGQNPASMAGWFQGEDPIWKVFYVPYHTPMHRTNLGTNLQMAISGVKIRPLWWAGSRVGIPSGKCFMCHITPQCMEQHYLGPLLPSPGTNPGFQGSKNDYFIG